LKITSTDEIHEILVRRVDEQRQATGMVVGMVEPNGRRVVAYGNLAMGGSRKVDGDTVFEIGSVTKVFTSLLLAEMANRNELALDDPAGRYLPEHVRMPERSGKSITLVDLATHRSGLPGLPSNLKLKDGSNPYAGYSEDDLYEFLSGYTLPRDPGSEFEYSNLGAGLLGHLLARRAGTDYESLVRSRITALLGMNDTGITLSSTMKQRMATGHNALLAPVANWDFQALAGAGALRSSVNDMLTFLEAFLGHKESTLAPAMKAMLEGRLAWFLVGEGAWHGGGTGGFRSFVGCAPKAGIGVVVLSNASTPAGVDDIGAHLLDPRVALAEPKAPGEHVAIVMDAEVLDGYAGRYQLGPNLILEITREGDRLFAQAFAQGIAAPRFELFAEGEREFFSRVGHEIAFETTKLVLRRVGRPDMWGERLSRL
jgi:serine-type D-Ala-D-Ala carboxypeptidase/endopeptidase